jgi:hypothetical protein
MFLHTTIIIHRIVTRHIDDKFLVPIIRLVERAGVKAAVSFGRLAGRGEGTRDDIVNWMEVEDDRVAGGNGKSLRIEGEPRFADLYGVDFGRCEGSAEKEEGCGIHDDVRLDV